MRKKRIFSIALCAIMASLVIVLDRFGSLELFGKIKITFYALPLIVVGISFGLTYGLITGVVAGVVLQLTSPYGIGPTSVFWALAPIAWGGISGLMSKILQKKNKFVLYVVAIACASLAANLLNTFAMFMETLLIKDSWYTVTAIMLDWPLRLLTMVITIVPYTIIGIAVCEAFKKLNN